jgi:hypothetical protein
MYLGIVLRTEAVSTPDVEIETQLKRKSEPEAHKRESRGFREQ